MRYEVVHLLNKKARRKPPKYGRQKRKNGADQAILRHGGKRHYLGVWDSPESYQRYEQLVSQIRVHGKIKEEDKEGDLTVSGLVEQFLRHAETYYQKNGRPTSSYANHANAAAMAVSVFGSLPAAEFGRKELYAVQEKMMAEGWVRNTINYRIGKIKWIFKWAAKRGLIPAGVIAELSLLDHLQKGRTLAKESEPVEPVNTRDFLRARKKMGKKIAAMATVQWWTGMRPGEVCMMRGKDIDRSKSVWVYIPREHKMEHKGKDRPVPIGPNGQKAIRAFLCEGDLFKGKRGRYTISGYRDAVYRACDIAGVKRFSPNRLRHSAGTRIRERGGLEAAQIQLGHSSRQTTEGYARPSLRAAMATMEKIG